MVRSQFIYTCLFIYVQNVHENKTFLNVILKWNSNCVDTPCIYTYILTTHVQKLNVYKHVHSIYLDRNDIIFRYCITNRTEWIIKKWIFLVSNRTGLINYTRNIHVYIYANINYTRFAMDPVPIRIFLCVDRKKKKDNKIQLLFVP